MNVNQVGDRLTFFTVPAFIRIGSGILIGFWGTSGVYLGIFMATYEGTSINDIILSLVLSIIGILILFFGAYLLPTRWGKITFVRSMGELTIIKRQVFLQKIDSYRLSDIKGVVLWTWDPYSHGQGPIFPTDQVDLVVSGVDSRGRLTDAYNVISTGRKNSQRKNAEAIAAFLGLMVQLKPSIGSKWNL